MVRNFVEHPENNIILYDNMAFDPKDLQKHVHTVALIDELGNNYDNIQQTDISVLDLSKAYDKVFHQLLPIKLLLH